jgi:DNA-binding beta-propeller fold protein YncE
VCLDDMKRQEKMMRYPNLMLLTIVILLTACSANRPPAAERAPSRTLLDSRTLASAQTPDTLLAPAGVSSTPRLVAVTPAGVWILAEHAIQRLDVTTNTVSATIALPDVPISVVADADAVWVVLAATGEVTHVENVPRTGTLVRIDPATNQIAASIPLDSAHPVQATVANTELWVTAFEPTMGAPAEQRIVRVDREAGRVTATITVPWIAISGGDLTAGAGALWHVRNGAVARFDPATGNVIATVRVAGNTDHVAFGADAVWITDQSDGRVYRIDPATSQVAATISVPGIARAISAAEGTVWVMSSRGSEQLLSRIDPASDQVTGTITRNAEQLVLGIERS